MRERYKAKLLSLEIMKVGTVLKVKKLDFYIMFSILTLILLSFFESYIRTMVVMFVTFILIRYLNTIIHELGHFISGRIVGFDINEVIIGEQFEIFKTKILGTSFSFNFGGGGITSGVITKKSNTKIRIILFILGGVILQSIMIIIVYLSFELRNDEYWYLPLIFIVTNIWTIFKNLLPRSYYFNDELYPSDGLRILQIIRK